MYDHAIRSGLGSGRSQERFSKLIACKRDRGGRAHPNHFGGRSGAISVSRTKTTPQGRPFDSYQADSAVDSLIIHSKNCSSELPGAARLQPREVPGTTTVPAASRLVERSIQGKPRRTGWYVQVSANVRLDVLVLRNCATHCEIVLRKTLYFTLVHTSTTQNCNPVSLHHQMGNPF